MQWEVKDINSIAQESLLEKPDALQRLFLLRGLITEEDRESFLSPDFEHDIHDPFLFVAMKDTVRRFKKAKDDKEKIGIYGDYDADGVSGATLLKTALDDLGFDSEVYIPHKERDGHGLSMLAVEHFSKNGIKLIVTVDCGITNIAQIAEAKKRGIESIIIDHHHVPEVLPDAVAVINPKLPNSGYPFADLCGTGTAFKVVQALYAEFAPDVQEKTKWLLDLVAIATVADCMPLIGENRTLVTYGLIVLGKTRRRGLKEMFRVGRINIDARNLPTAHTIGFQIAPRINAAGRMGHAQDAYELLIDEGEESAHAKACALEEMNNQRRKVSESVTKEATAKISAMKNVPSGIIIGSEEYFHGVVGLIAGRLAEKFNRPVGVFQHMGETSLGSFRSRSGVHIVDILNAVNDALPGALIKYGGHAAAAGATIQREQFDSFAQIFDRHVQRAIEDMGGLSEKISVDAEILVREITIELAQEIKKFAPFGIGNEEPLFAITNARIDAMRGVGAGEKHIKFAFGDMQSPGQQVDAIGFSMAQKVKDIQVGDHVHILAHIQINNWQGQKTAQLMVKDIEKVQTIE